MTLVGLVVASSSLLLGLAWKLTFFQDTWAFLMTRREMTVDAFLRPHNEHIVLFPVAIEKLLLAVFGMSTALPEYVVSTLMLAATAVLVFVYVRRSLGPWPATMVAAVLLFLGPAWQVLLWPFEIGFVGSVLAGVAMLLVLDRDDGRGDPWACVLLTVSVGFSSLGLSFVLAAAVDFWQRRSTRGLGRAYVFCVPLLLYLAWYAGWGHTAEHHLTLENIATSPVYLFNGVASSLDTVLGLSTVPVQGLGAQPSWGRPLLIAALILLAVQQSRRPGFSPRLWPVLAAMVSYWMLAGFNYILGREATSSRYAYAGAVFILLVAADLLHRTDLNARRLWIAGVVTLAAVAANLVVLHEGQEVLAEQTAYTRADTAAIEIAKRTVAPSFELTPTVAGTGSLVDVDAADYLEAVSEYGSPAYSVSELEDASLAGRRQADIVLAAALPVSSVTRPGAELPSRAERRCSTEGGGSSVVKLRPGQTRILVSPGPQAKLALGRFAEEFPVPIAPAPGGSTTRVRIPMDPVSRPWRLLVDAAQPVRVCSPGG